MFTIKIANLNVKIIHKYSFVKNLCKDYLIDTNNYTFEVSATQKQIDKEMKDSKYIYPEGYCESICIYRNLCEKMLDYNRFLFHASVVEVDGKSYAFAAQSGTGKSTHTNLWLDYFKDKARIINGDKPILEIKENSIIAYGTPWCGKEGININTSSPLNSICFLERGTINELSKIDEINLTDKIIHQVIFPTNIERTNKLFDMLNILIETIPCYLLKCNISKEAVEVAYNGMNKEDNHENK